MISFPLHLNSLPIKIFILWLVLPYQQLCPFLWRFFRIIQNVRQTFIHFILSTQPDFRTNAALNHITHPVQFLQYATIPAMNFPFPKQKLIQFLDGIIHVNYMCHILNIQNRAFCTNFPLRC